MTNTEQPRDLARLIAILRDNWPAFSSQYRIRTLGVFGSYARGTQRPESDLDVLVTFDDPPGLLTYIEIEDRLAALLGVDVDLVMQDALKPGVGQRIMREVVPV